MRFALALMTLCACRLRFQEQPTDDAAPQDTAADALPPLCTTQWGAPVARGGDNPAGWEYAPAVTADGLEIFFHATRAGGLGNADIWTARRPTINMPFGVPTVA